MRMGMKISFALLLVFALEVFSSTGQSITSDGEIIDTDDDDDSISSSNNTILNNTIIMNNTNITDDPVVDKLIDGEYFNCSSFLLNDANIKTAVDTWLNTYTRDVAELTYGGHISQWDTRCITNMKAVFRFSVDFNEDLSGWDVSRVRYLDQAFEVSSGFRGNVSTWDVSSVIDMNRIFHKSIAFDADVTGVSKWNTERLRDLRYGFASSLDFSGDLRGWKTSRLTDFDHMFSTSIDFQGNLMDWDLQQVTSLDYAFHSSIRFRGRIDDWKLLALESMKFTFADSDDLVPLDKDGNPTVLDWNTDNVTAMNFCFQGARNFNSDTVALWTTQKLREMPLVFASSKNFHGTQQSSWSTSKVKSFVSMFASSTNFTSPFISSFDTSGVMDMAALFKFSDGFAGNVTAWTTSSLKLMDEFAFGSKNFQGDVSGFDVSHVTSMKDAFTRAEQFPAKMISNWNTRLVRNMIGMFDEADWALDDEETGSPKPYPLCWDISSVSYTSLERATCSSPKIAFACECISSTLAEEINYECDEPKPPPCIGISPDATVVDDDATSNSGNSRTDRVSSASGRCGVGASLLLCLCILNCLLVGSLR